MPRRIIQPKPKRKKTKGKPKIAEGERLTFTQGSVHLEKMKRRRETPLLADDWSRQKEEILRSAQQSVELYRDLDRIFSQALAPAGAIGHNRGPELVEELRKDEAKAVEATDVIKRELEVEIPSPINIGKARRIFLELAKRAKKLLVRLKGGAIEGIGEGFGKGIGKEGIEVAGPALLERLVHGLGILVDSLKSFF